jgi:hypothetical protein
MKIFKTINNVICIFVNIYLLDIVLTFFLKKYYLHPMLQNYVHHWERGRAHRILGQGKAARRGSHGVVVEIEPVRSGRQAAATLVKHKQPIVEVAVVAPGFCGNNP